MVVGGGCYGSYYVRQLGRARAAGSATWSTLLVIDCDPGCQVARLSDADRPPGLRLETATWGDYFRGYLAAAAECPAMVNDDAIVPSPLMPHLLADWLLERARDRWPARRVHAEPLGSVPGIPWQMTGADGTQYVSFAEWVCPINCIEPTRCPATRGERTWSLPPALASYADNERSAGRPVVGPLVFHCTHRTHGVGMIDVRHVIAADATITESAALGQRSILVGTASHCHGALQCIVVGE